MKKLFILFLLIFTSNLFVKSQSTESPCKHPIPGWFSDAKFGLFIHWGVYAIPAGIYKGVEIKDGGEWIMKNAHIPTA